MSRINFDRISKAVYYFDNIPVGFDSESTFEEFNIDDARQRAAGQEVNQEMAILTNLIRN